MCRLVHNHKIVDIYYKGKKKAPQSVLNSKKLTALYVSVIDVGRTISIPFIWMYSTTQGPWKDSPDDIITNNDSVWRCMYVENSTNQQGLLLLAFSHAKRIEITYTVSNNVQQCRLYRCIWYQYDFFQSLFKYFPWNFTDQRAAEFSVYMRGRTVCVTVYTHTHIQRCSLDRFLWNYWLQKETRLWLGEKRVVR